MLLDQLSSSASVPEAVPAPPTSPKILVVDDSQIQAKAVAKSLLQLGYNNFVLCSDPFQALPLLKKGGIDIIFCDWNMPGCNGGELYNAIKKEPDLAGIPFVLLTANSEKEQVIQALRLGIKEYIVKPASSEILQAKMALIKK